MTPRQYRKRGQQVIIRFAISRCSLGQVLVAVTEKGVCQIALGDHASDLRADLLARLPAAKEISADPALADLLAVVLSLIESPAGEVTFPLEIRGTVFQQKVWRALRAIPPGQTLTYCEVAAAIGHPLAARAVASACAANSLAVAVPCHRVVRSDGSLGGYRWGVARKEKLLAREGRDQHCRRNGPIGNRV
jgi:AraC family transcriptional regulator of adaptative response/methylated-DNA-[protein]-cysteine methyltransferase